jgi:hypothetical protein
VLCYRLKPRIILERRGLQSCGRKPQIFHQEEGVDIIQAIFDDVFEEALGFQVSSEHGGGHGTAEEE